MTGLKHKVILSFWMTCVCKYFLGWRSAFSVDWASGSGQLRRPRHDLPRPEAAAGGHVRSCVQRGILLKVTQHSHQTLRAVTKTHALLYAHHQQCQRLWIELRGSGSDHQKRRQSPILRYHLGELSNVKLTFMKGYCGPRFYWCLSFQVRQCSEKFLEDLEKRWQSSVMLDGLCEVVRHHAKNNFQVYVRYCSNQHQQDKIMTKLR